MDEDVGVPGMVPTAFALIACRYYQHKSTVDVKILKKIIKTGDYIYSVEHDGMVLKSLLNRSKAYNTDLLAAQALFELSSILSDGSIRKRMYLEAVHRILRRVLLSQFFNGGFPYQTYTFGVPFLYHAMVTAQQVL